MDKKNIFISKKKKTDAKQKCASEQKAVEAGLFFFLLQYSQLERQRNATLINLGMNMLLIVYTWELD